MRHFFKAIFFSVVLFISGSSQMRNAQLTVRIVGIEELKGNIMLVICDQKDHFLSDEFYKSEIIPVRDNNYVTATWDIPPGEYAISVYHDINSDEELNANFIGIPREPYGFSNNAKGTFGPPDYEEAKFMLTASGLVKEIKLN